MNDDRWAMAVDQILREYHQSCLDRGFYRQDLMDRYGERPITPSAGWSLFAVKLPPP